MDSSSNYCCKNSVWFVARRYFSHSNFFQNLKIFYGWKRKDYSVYVRHVLCVTPIFCITYCRQLLDICYGDGDWFLFWEIARGLISSHPATLDWYNVLLFLPSVLPVLFNFNCWWVSCYSVVILQLGMYFGWFFGKVLGFCFSSVFP